MKDITNLGMKTKIDSVQVLLIEDNPGDARLIQEMLVYASDFVLSTTNTLQSGIDLLRDQPADVALLDLSLPDSVGIDTLLKFRAELPHIPVVVLTGLEDTMVGVRAVQAGGQDYLVKDAVETGLLTRTLRYAIERHRGEEALRQSEEEYRSLINDVFDNSMVGALILDADFRVVWVNEAIEIYFGIRRETILGKDKRKLVSEQIKYIFEHPDRFANHVLNAYHHNMFNDRFECHILPSDNREERWLQHWSQPIHSGMYAGGRIEQYTDISSRKHIENAEHEQRILAEALQDTAAVLTSTLNLDEVLDRILENIGRVVPHDTANIMLLEDDVVTIARYQGDINQELRTALSGLRLQLNNAPNLYHMLETGQAIVIADIQSDVHADILTVQPDVCAYAAVPIRLQNVVIGFINIFSFTPGFFHYAHTERLMACAEQAAIAIQNARLYKQSQELATLEERQRLARDLHDSVNQTLFSTSVMSESALKQWDTDRDKAHSLLRQLHTLTHTALAEMRILLLELRPASLTQVGLKKLIEQYIQSLASRKQVKFTQDIDDIPDLPPDVHIALYRVAQEALNNIVKHAQATKSTITLKLEEGEIRLLIEDNGRGFDRDGVSPARLGLGIMCERIDGIGGVFELDSRVGNGTRVKVNLILDPALQVNERSSK
jgi:signal transduction histidine kinase/DNA-binding response OmpR family regulator